MAWWKVGYSFIAMVLAVIIETGCSVNGWATKPVADGSDLQSGQTVSIVTKDGNIVLGKFEEVQTLSGDEYKKSYNDPTQNYFGTKLLPKIGQTVYVTTLIAENKTWKGTMVGFDHEGLLLKTDGNETRKYYISTLNDITGQDGSLIPKMKLREMFLNGEIPFMTVLAIETSRGEIKLPINTIEKIIVEPAVVNGARAANPALSKAEFQRGPIK